MSIDSEAAAESALMGAIMAPEQQVSPPDAQDIDQDDIQAPNEVEGEQREEAPEAKTEEAAAPEDDEIEIPGDDGKEPTRLKVADLVAKAQEFDRIEAQKAQIIEQVEREAAGRAAQHFQAVEQYSQQTAYMIQAALQMLQPPQPPNADAMLNPASPQYNPDEYHRQFAAYQRMQGSFQQAQGLGNELMRRAQEAQAQAQDQRETQELQRLQRAWPEFSQPETMNKFVDDMTKTYGFTPQELDAVLTDHRQALVARDALAFRAMKAQSGNVKAQVEAKAPKLVRSKQEAKASTPQRARDGSGQFVSGALADLKNTNSDDAAARYFAGLVKAGRI